MTSVELRQRFLDYFAARGHAVVPSAPLVPKSDPTLLFTNAGMVPFKGVFLGEEERPYTRAVSAQKCVRAGGKHSDLENVGRTSRHHTFFEMLGNFSFGDYFKKEAIAYAWEFLTKEVKLPTDRLWVTIYRDDEEAFRLWRELTPMAADRIVRFGEKDNFWSMGDTGPCGPCSEIHFDQGPGVPGDPVPNGAGDRVIEVWNLVFMQYNRGADGKLTPLPKPSIDTGMGLERLAAVAQGVPSNYETDLFRPLLETTAGLAGTAYGRDPKRDVSLRVIADHARTIAFLLADGVFPANDGRGYVLRRILRRAARHGRLLGLKEPFLHRVCGEVVTLMRGPFPELEEARKMILRLTLLEEERFAYALEQGLRLLEEEVGRLRQAREKTLAGEFLFRLYDTYGFPLDLMQEVAEEQGLALDEAGFRDALEGQRQRARAAWAGSGEEKVPAVYRELASSVPPTRFLGYEGTTGEGHVLALVKDGARISEAQTDEEVEILLDQTPFYSEAGGQVGDAGLLTGNGARVEILDTVKPTPAHAVHRGRVLRGAVQIGQTLQARVDAERRRATARNHTATHLLHAALKEVLGDHAKQAGSLVAPDRLRFDFTHFAPLAPREIDRIEELVNARIRDDYAVNTRLMPLEEAIASGAVALFGEKYDREVRVVEVPDFSKELCGGTHCRATGEIALLKIVSETGIAAGVRRIEAVTGEGAFRHLKEMEEELRRIADLMKTRDWRVAERVESLQADHRALQREIDRLKEARSATEAADVLKEVREAAGVRYLAKRYEGIEVKDLRMLGDKLKEKLGSGVLVLASAVEEKVTLLVMVTKDLTPRLPANDLVRALSPLLGGSGGGKADTAQAGGNDPSRIAKTLEAVPEAIA
ncbi:MAG: alanine--tRNA ligase, partial [Nitrospirae bacterium]|nr:alanine--tRNA ligase [Nitrospirota bacterium]